MEGVDRISELTDETLVNNIISRLDCTTKELIKTTATISKRWKNIWTQAPHLIFSYRDDHLYFTNDDICNYISFIDNTLNQCPENLNLKRFKLYIQYNSSLVNSDIKSRVNSWIRYAISRNVEDLDLYLRDAVPGKKFTYDDELFFNNLCFNPLKVSYCEFNPPNCAISWDRLEWLCLSRVTLDEDMIERIISGSPCLESLEMNDCHGYRRIDVTSTSVKKLVFSDFYCYRNYDDYTDSIKINAPYISSLTIKGKFEVELVMLDASSLIKAELDYCIDLERFDYTTPEEMLRGLLESLDHVKDIIINDFWWKFYDNLKARGDTSDSSSVVLKS